MRRQTVGHFTPTHHALMMGWISKAVSVAETFRQGGRGVTHDNTLEARPWNVPLDQIKVPIQIWHGEDDRLVSAQASRILTDALPGATTHLVPGAGHLTIADHASDILQSIL